MSEDMLKLAERLSAKIKDARHMEAKDDEWMSGYFEGYRVGLIEAVTALRASQGKD